MIFPNNFYHSSTYDIKYYCTRTCMNICILLSESSYFYKYRTVFLFYSFQLPVLAAAPDIQHPFSPHFPVKYPYFTQKLSAIKENPSKTPPFYPLKSSKILLFST